MVAPARMQRRPLVQSTSREAFRQRTVRPGGVPDRILEHLKKTGGACDFEIEHALGLPHQSVSGERRHLVEHGLVHATARKRPAPSGRLAIVWAAGPAPDSFRPGDVPPFAKANVSPAQSRFATERSA